MHPIAAFLRLCIFLVCLFIFSFWIIYEKVFVKRKSTCRKVKAHLQPFTVLFSFSAILVCFIDAQIYSCFREKMSEFVRQ